MASPKITPEYLINFIKGITTGPSDLDTIKTDVLKYISPNYTWDRVSRILNFDQTLQHLSGMRSFITSLEIEVKKIVVAADEKSFACQYRATINGEKKIVVALFADLDGEGKIAFVHEVVADDEEQQ